MTTTSEPLFGEALETPVATLLKPLLGAHMPTAGGPHNAITDGVAIGCRSVQIFTASPRQWRAPSIKPDMAEKFKAVVAENAITKTVAHDSYLINLAAEPGSDVLERSRAAFRAEIERSEALGVNFLVSHPGAHGGAGEDIGIARLIDSLNIIHQQTEGLSAFNGCKSFMLTTRRKPSAAMPTATPTSAKARLASKPSACWSTTPAWLACRLLWKPPTATPCTPSTLSACMI